MMDWPPLDMLRREKYDEANGFVQEYLKDLQSTNLDELSDSVQETVSNKFPNILRFLSKVATIVQEVKDKNAVYKTLETSVLACCAVYCATCALPLTVVQSNLICGLKVMHHVLYTFVGKICIQDYAKVSADLRRVVTAISKAGLEEVLQEFTIKFYTYVWNTALTFERMHNEFTGQVQVFFMRICALQILAEHSSVTHELVQKILLTLKTFVQSQYASSQRDFPVREEKVLTPQKAEVNEIEKEGSLCAFGVDGFPDSQIVYSALKDLLDKAAQKVQIEPDTLFHICCFINDFQHVPQYGKVKEMLMKDIPAMLETFQTVSDVVVSAVNLSKDFAFVAQQIQGRHTQSEKDRESLLELENILSWLKNIKLKMDRNELCLAIEICQWLFKQIIASARRSNFPLKKEWVDLLSQVLQEMQGFLISVRLWIKNDASVRKKTIDFSDKEKEKIAQIHLDSHRSWLIIYKLALAEHYTAKAEMGDGINSKAGIQLVSFSTAIDTAEPYGLMKQNARFHFGSLCIKLGHLMYNLKREEQAVLFYRTATEQLHTWCKLHHAAIRKNKIEEAGLLRLYDLLSRSLMTLGRYKEGLTCLQRSVQIQGKDWAQQEESKANIIRSWYKFKYALSKNNALTQDEILILQSSLGDFVENDQTAVSDALLLELHYLWCNQKRITSDWILQVLKRLQLEFGVDTEMGSVATLLVAQFTLLYQGQPLEGTKWDIEKSFANPAYKAAAYIIQACLRRNQLLSAFVCKSEFEETKKSALDLIMERDMYYIATLGNQIENELKHLIRLALKCWKQALASYEKVWEPTCLLETSHLMFLEIIMVVADLMKACREFVLQLELLTVAQRLVDRLGPIVSAMRRDLICCSMLDALAALGVQDIPASLAASLQLPGPTVEEKADDCQSKIQKELLLCLINFYLSAGKVEEANGLLQSFVTEGQTRMQEGKYERLMGEMLRMQHRHPDSRKHIISHAHRAFKLHYNELFTTLKRGADVNDIYTIWAKFVEAFESALFIARVNRHAGGQTKARCYLREGLTLSAMRGLLKWGIIFATGISELSVELDGLTASCENIQLAFFTLTLPEGGESSLQHQLWWNSHPLLSLEAEVPKPERKLYDLSGPCQCHKGLEEDALFDKEVGKVNYWAFWRIKQSCWKETKKERQDRRLQKAHLAARIFSWRASLLEHPADCRCGQCTDADWQRLTLGLVKAIVMVLHEDRLAGRFLHGFFKTLHLFRQVDHGREVTGILQSARLLGGDEEAGCGDVRHSICLTELCVVMAEAQLYSHSLRQSVDHLQLALLMLQTLPLSHPRTLLIQARLTHFQAACMLHLLHRQRPVLTNFTPVEWEVRPVNKQLMAFIFAKLESLHASKGEKGVAPVSKPSVAISSVSVGTSTVINQPDSSPTSGVALKTPKPSASSASSAVTKTPKPPASSASSVASKTPKPPASSASSIAPKTPEPLASSASSVASKTPKPPASSASSVASKTPKPPALSASSVTTPKPASSCLKRKAAKSSSSSVEMEAKPVAEGKAKDTVSAEAVTGKSTRAKKKVTTTVVTDAEDEINSSTVKATNSEIKVTANEVKVSSSVKGRSAKKPKVETSAKACKVETSDGMLTVTASCDSTGDVEQGCAVQSPTDNTASAAGYLPEVPTTGRKTTGRRKKAATVSSTRASARTKAASLFCFSKAGQDSDVASSEEGKVKEETSSPVHSDTPAVTQPLPPSAPQSPVRRALTFSGLYFSDSEDEFKPSTPMATPKSLARSKGSRGPLKVVSSASRGTASAKSSRSARKVVAEDSGELDCDVGDLQQDLLNLQISEKTLTKSSRKPHKSSGKAAAESKARAALQRDLTNLNLSERNTTTTPKVKEIINANDMSDSQRGTEEEGDVALQAIASYDTRFATPAATSRRGRSARGKAASASEPRKSTRSAKTPASKALDDVEEKSSLTESCKSRVRKTEKSTDRECLSESSRSRRTTSSRSSERKSVKSLEFDLMDVEMVLGKEDGEQAGLEADIFAFDEEGSEEVKPSRGRGGRKAKETKAKAGAKRTAKTSESAKVSANIPKKKSSKSTGSASASKSVKSKPMALRTITEEEFTDESNKNNSNSQEVSAEQAVSCSVETISEQWEGEGPKEAGQLAGEEHSKAVPPSLPGHPSVIDFLTEIGLDFTAIEKVKVADDKPVAKKRQLGLECEPLNAGTQIDVCAYNFACECSQKFEGEYRKSFFTYLQNHGKSTELSKENQEACALSHICGNSTSDEVREKAMKAIEGRLSASLYELRSFPYVSISGDMCKLLAHMRLQQQAPHDPWEVAALLGESAAMGCRHQFLMHYEKQTRVDVQKVYDNPEDDLDNLFFPWDTDKYREVIQSLPKGWTVCQLSVINNASYSALMLTRMTCDEEPLTIELPGCFDEKGCLLFSDMADILHASSRTYQVTTDRELWWKSRCGIDYFVQHAVYGMQCHWIGPLLGMLMGQTSDAIYNKDFNSAASRLAKMLYNDAGITVPEAKARQMLQLLLCWPDLRAILWEVMSYKMEDTPHNRLLCEVIGSRVFKDVPSTRAPDLPVIFILDKHLINYPLEQMDLIRNQPITRMPSLALLHHMLRIHGDGSKPGTRETVMCRGVDPKSVFYILDPKCDLVDSFTFLAPVFEEFRLDGCSQVEPSKEVYRDALTNHDLFMYNGHGSGNQYFSSEDLLKIKCRAVALLFGCSSGRNRVMPHIDADAYVYAYLLAGSPCVLGNLWDVTDKDTDLICMKVLKYWITNSSKEKNILLPTVLQRARNCKLEALNGYAPVLYGLPVRLKPWEHCSV